MANAIRRKVQEIRRGAFFFRCVCECVCVLACVCVCARACVDIAAHSP